MKSLTNTDLLAIDVKCFFASPITDRLCCQTFFVLSVFISWFSYTLGCMHCDREMYVFYCSPDMVWVLSFCHRTSGAVLTSGEGSSDIHNIQAGTPFFVLHSLLSLPPSLHPSLPPSLPPLMSRSDSSLHSLPDIRESVHGVHLTSPVSGQSACPLDLGQVPHGPSSLLPHGQRHQTSGERDLRSLYAAACLSNLKL